MNIEETLHQKKLLIEQKLENILSGKDTFIHKAMRNSVLSGGKRFRPLLVLSSGKCLHSNEEELLSFACAIELIHNYSLIHDDLPAMDDDDFRRGIPTCHKTYGEAIAILAGDALLTLAFKELINAPVRKNYHQRKNQVINQIATLAGVEGMVGGQYMDITYSPKDYTDKEFHDLIMKKTGGLIMASVKTGALLGSASDSQMEAMEEYGKNIGLAFQIRDDILDFFEETKEDKQNEPNYVSFFGLKKAEERLVKYIETACAILDKATLKGEELKYLAQMLLIKRKTK